MPSVIINLKEIFATDNQVEISAKVNFNFNQLLALGIGQPGPIGLTGPIGPAGPIGPVGQPGPTGSVIYSSSSTTGTPSVVPPSEMVNNDILITSDTIWKKTVDSLTSTVTWTKVADFNQLVVTALGVNISPYLLLSPGSRVVKPRITTGTDLTNTSTSTDPNYATPGLGPNYQTVLYNFNEQNTSSVRLNGSGTITISSNGATSISFNAASVNTSTNEITVVSTSSLTDGDYVIYSNNGYTTVGGLNNYTPYYVKVTGSTTLKLCASPGDVVANNPIDLTSASSGLHKLITVPANVDSIFPNTSNLTLYSFFEDALINPAKEFATSNKGYRHQLEIGSIDTIPTVYPNGSGGTISAASYLISPSFENLRVRKYRIANSGWATDYPGAYYLRAEYDMSSTGVETAESFAPRRNSEHVWKINKAASTLNAGRTVEMRFTNSNIFSASDSSAGFTLDGIIFKKNASLADSNTYYVGLGFHESTSSKAKLAASSNITVLQIDGLSIELKNGSSTGTVSINSSTGVVGVSANGFDLTTIAPSGITIQTVGAPADIRIKTGNTGSLVKIGNSSLSVPVAPIVVANDRLGAGLPFPVTQVPSTDPNTLDDYEEGTWTPTLYGGGFTETGQDLSFASIMDSTTGRNAGYAQPAKAIIGDSGYTEGPWIYSGSTSNSSDRIIPITINYAKYIKVGRLVRCWVNFTISPEFNFITNSYTTAGGNDNDPVFMQGSSVKRFNPLYNSEKEPDSQGRYLRSAIGLTLPFAPDAAPITETYQSNESVLAYYAVNDAFSSTQVIGSFHKHFDFGDADSTIGPPPDWPVVINPMFADRTVRLNSTTGVFESGGPSKNGPMSNATGAAATKVFPINNSGKTEIRIGRVPMKTVQTGSGLGSYKTYTLMPAALFYGSRLWDDGTNKLTSMCPVTAIDCLYESWVPTVGATSTVDPSYKPLGFIRFQAEFSYLAAV